MTDNERARQAAASHSLEELAIAAKDVVAELRVGQSPGKAYALAYELRWRMGKIVASLGAGVPNAADRTYAQEVVDSAIWNGGPKADG